MMFMHNLFDMEFHLNYVFKIIQMISEILLGTILVVHFIELCVLISIFKEDEPPELTEEMRSKLYS